VIGKETDGRLSEVGMSRIGIEDFLYRQLRRKGSSFDLYVMFQNRSGNPWYLTSTQPGKRACRFAVRSV
jgi:hypothetical protein